MPQFGQELRHGEHASAASERYLEALEVLDAPGGLHMAQEPDRSAGSANRSLNITPPQVSLGKHRAV
jgi:hypothetical protein